MLPLRYYQQQAFDNFLDYTANNWGKNPIIVLPTGCVSWDTIINENRCSLGRKKRIDKMYKAFNGLRTKSRYNYDKSHKTYVRSYNGKTIQLNEIESVSYSGIKRLLRIELENGNYLKATPDHKIMTDAGWVQMQFLALGSNVMCDTLKAKKKGNIATKRRRNNFICNLWFHPYARQVKTNKEKRGYTKRIEEHRAIYECYINNISFDMYKKILRTDAKKSAKLFFVDPSIYDIHHIDRNHHNNDIKNLQKMTKYNHQKLHSEKNRYNFNQGVPVFSKVVSIEDCGEDHTYDIGCYENHNFVANGIVVHNSGKSLVQAYIVEEIIKHEGTRVLNLTHQKELIKQNYIELMDNFGNEMFLDVGIYSAGLKCRDTQNRIIFAGIQSVYKKAWELGWFDVILIDECHLIPHRSEGMYRTFLAEMQKINKNVVICGLSATHYRMKEGLLTEGKGAFFHDVCHETTIRELMDPNDPRNLDNVQYLCTLKSKNAVNKADLSRVSIRGGEYVPGEMEKAFLFEDLVGKAVNEIIEYTHDRKKNLIFTAGIQHCEEVTHRLLDCGHTTQCVHSKKSSKENEKILKDFKDGRFRYLVNVNTLTTGFNEKAIDCIALLRSTLSPGLYYQICGRGLRLHPDKQDCLVLDFGRNIERHGPIDQITIRKKRDGKKRAEGMPQKECPNCQSLVNLPTMQCPDCGYEFPEKDKHDEEASDLNVVSQWQDPEEKVVTDVKYFRHKKAGKPDSLKVEYASGLLHNYSTWVCIEHFGRAKREAIKWLSFVTDREIETVTDALKYCKEFKTPSKIIVDSNGRYEQIIGYTYQDEKEEEVEKDDKEDESIDSALEKLMF
jgi:DNA repair protein RadD